MLSLAVRATGLACASLLLAGVGGVASIDSSSSSRPVSSSVRRPGRSADRPAATVPPLSRATVPQTTTTTAPSPPSTALDQATLEASLLVANDLGGYYTSIPADSAPRLASSGCLAPLGQPPAAKRQAVQYLRGPFGPDLPDIDEEVDAYATPAAAAAGFATLGAASAACTSTRIALAGAPPPLRWHRSRSRPSGIRP